MTQLSIGWGAREQGLADWRDELAWAQRAIDVLGHKVVAGELDIAPSTLTDALKERDHKGVKAEWLCIIRRMSSAVTAREHAALVCASAGCETPIPRRTMTDTEELAELKRLLADRLGDVGKQLVLEVLGGKR